MEIGGGNSCFLDAIRRAIAPDEYHIIDSNQYSLDLLRRRIGADPAVHLYCQDVRDVDLDLKADVAFSVGLIEHFREAETRRAVRAHLDLLSSPWIKARRDGAPMDGGNAADEPSGPWASGVQPPADRGLPCT